MVLWSSVLSSWMAAKGEWSHIHFLKEEKEEKVKVLKLEVLKEMVELIEGEEEMAFSFHTISDRLSFNFISVCGLNTNAFR